MPDIVQSKPASAQGGEVDAVVEWIIAGHAEAHILGSISENFPDAKPAKLIVAAWNKIAASGKVESDVLRGFAIEATREIYQKCIEAADYPTALRALRQLLDVAGN